LTLTRAREAVTSGRRALASRRFAVHLAVLAAYLAAGVAETWPRATDLGGRLPGTTDAASYVWAFWWVARQVTHLHDPWFTSYMAAPAGVRLGFTILMPLPAAVLAPVTLAFGPNVSFEILTLAVPGLLCYVMYRVARLWLASQAGAVAAGALFGLATMLVWQDQLHLNVAAGELFLPMALEASVRLRRNPGRRQAVILGLVLGAAVLVNQESAVLALIVAAAALLPWLIRRPPAGEQSAGEQPAREQPGKLRFAALAGLVSALVASPQIIAMAGQALAGGTAVPPSTLAHWDASFGVGLPALFAPSPRLADFGLAPLARAFHYVQPGEGVPTFGLVLSLLALAGLAISWRHRHARYLALLWLGAAALALGPFLIIGSRAYVPAASVWHGVVVSGLMPYTWFVRIPGLSAFREADRFALLGLVPAALLAGRAVDWLRSRARPLMIAVLVLAALEAGWSGRGGAIPVTLAAVDGPVAADHSGSVVVDVPFGLRGGLPDYGKPMVPQSLVLATDDGHPRAISYTAWVPPPTVADILGHPFYTALLAAQDGRHNTAAQVAAARADARRMNIGWVLVWRRFPSVPGFLREAGFRPGYRADGVTVYRPLSSRR
jgi:hypothetical protein